MQFRCKLNSSTLSNTISALNDSLLADIHNHYREYVLTTCARAKARVGERGG